MRGRYQLWSKPNSTCATARRLWLWSWATNKEIRGEHKTILQMKFFVRTAANPMSIVPAVRQQIQSVEKDLPRVDLGTQVEEMAGERPAESGQWLCFAE